jgi:ABC-type polysaccharide/polyol phosphate export systems, permease component
MDANETIHHIEPKRRWLDVDIRGLWRYRDLYKMYIKRDIVTYYKQTIFGPIWYVIQPVLTTIMYMFVFGGLAGISTDGVPQPLFYLAGISIWGYFSSCFNSCSDVFGANAFIFGKVYFPRLVVPLASLTSNLIRLLIQLGIFLIVYFYYIISGTFTPNASWSILLAPAFIMMAGLHAMSWGLLMSSWTTKYRDLKYVIQFGLQLLMYATPVIYPLSFAPENYRWVLEINPLTPIFEAFKYSFLGVGTFDAAGLLYSGGFMCITLFLSVLVFNRTETSFMDTI